jgi:Protein of unknown function (DUF3606)
MTEIVSEQQLSPKYIVDVTKPSHVAWWAAAFEVPERTLIEAVEVVGPQATEVFRYLQQDAARAGEESALHRSPDRRHSGRREADRRATELALPDEVAAGQARHGSDRR